MRRAVEPAQCAILISRTGTEKITMQSTSEHDREVVVQERAARGVLRHWKMVAIAVGALGADQLTKLLIRANMRIGESWPEEGFLRLTHGTNTGSAFGLFQDQTLVLTIASVVAIGFVFLFYRNDGGSTWLSWLTSGLILGGALGNLIDRVIAGKVTDFIDVGPWPVFNIADSSIVVGIIVLCASVLLRRDKRADAPESPDSVAHEQTTQ